MTNNKTTITSIRRKTLVLLLLLVCGTAGMRAQQEQVYYIFWDNYEDRGYFVRNGDALGVSTTFTPDAVWIANHALSSTGNTSLRPYTNPTKYLYGSSNTEPTSVPNAAGNGNSTIRGILSLSNTEQAICFISGANDYHVGMKLSGNWYFMYDPTRTWYDGTHFSFRSGGRYQTSFQRQQVTVATTEPAYTDFAIKGDDMIASTGQAYVFTHTSVLKVPAYTAFSFTTSKPIPNPEGKTMVTNHVHNWYNGQDYGELLPPGVPVETASYSWSIEPNNYATVNSTTGEVTATSLPDTPVTVKLTCTFSDGTVTKTAVKNLNLVNAINARSLNDITSATATYRLDADFTPIGTPRVGGSGAVIGTEANPFRGTIDGQMQTFSVWSNPLFEYVQDATIKNITIENATIYTSGDAGAIACVANGASRIYNIGIRGGFMSGSGNVGGIVGMLDGTSRVINCYSFADITDGTTVGGIVGNNRYATTADDLRTMVMNCMMYGDITGGSNVYPVYGGEKINNAGEKGVNNYNFYRDEAAITIAVNNYNCSWPAEEEYLTRFDYFRSILNANRALCAWWITGNADDTDEVAKWVYAPQEAPYPILKPWGRYPSMINRDIDERSLYPRGANAYEGRTMGTLSVNVESGKALSTILQLTITDIDSLHYDYGYYKVQLPYYNDVFGDPDAVDFTTRYGGNYGDQVVTGWDVISVTGGSDTPSTFSTDRDSGYNFADRHCTQKDLYSVSGRVFAQGGYFYVPEGVTGITIRAHWAKAYYCTNTDYARDRINFSIASDNAVTSHPFTPFGTINTFNGRTIYAGLKVAQQAINSTGGTGVYDNAIVLVGNVQHCNGGTNDLGVNYANKGFTIMSVDLDMDCEPDYVLPLQSGNYSASKQWLSPIRFDFVQVPDLGMALKLDGTVNRLAIACIKMYGHFEITETASLHFNEIYFGTASANKKETPLILNGGQFIEFVCMDGSGANFSQDKTLYIIAGGNVKMRSLYQGNHNGQAFKIKHAPMNVMGGDFEECYLSGNLRSMTPSDVWADNPHLFTNGGHFGIIAGAGQESVNGDVHYKIDHSLIDEFYGGATSAGGQMTGSIDVQIDNSLVKHYCGGPMVGDMPDGTTITTHATGTTFRQFFGAGNGGTSFTLLKSYDYGAQQTRTPDNGSWKLLNNYQPMHWTSNQIGSGYEAKYHFEIWTTPSGTRLTCASRLYIYGAQFAATQTGNVTSVLNGCTFLGDFYGGGNLGSVKGDVTSTLTGCTVHGNAYGAGFSATIPSFDCYLTGGLEYPGQDPNTSICHGYKVNNFTRYTWTNEGVNGEIFTRDGINYAHTNYSLANLGVVQGNATLNIAGNTTIMGDVYGGGALASANTIEGATATVNLTGGTIVGNVYGGGQGDAKTSATVGNTVVNLNQDVADTGVKGCVVKGSIFGGNNINGTPQGDITVHIHKTQNDAANQIVNMGNVTNAKQRGRYDLEAVYGGGNQAAYNPPTPWNGTTGSKSQVIIDGCEATSIGYVYGGGNAASVPETNVTMNGCYEVGWLFGGGNGAGEDNPGANVGLIDVPSDNATTVTTKPYGTGNANTNIQGGTVGHLFGGSNERGNIVGIASMNLNEPDDCDCPINVTEELFGFGNAATMDGDGNMNIGCVSGTIAEVYGGAKAADVGGSIDLHINSGTFGKVFGGNKNSGIINGTVSVTIEETGCKPIVIRELYGAGNMAAYTAPEELPDYPKVNIVSCTEIGYVYGGGYGETAVVRGNPQVCVNMEKGAHAALIDDQLGTIGTIFGGGNAARVDGNTAVRIGTEQGKGAHITGNVFGGGNQADVNGKANVLIGK